MKKTTRITMLYVGTSSDQHLSKLLLELLAADANMDALQLYRKYLDATVSYTINLRRVSMLTDKLLRQFYQADDLKAAPKYLDFYSGSDLSQLESVVKRRLVLLIENTKGQYHKYFDKRIFDHLVPLDEELEYSAGAPCVIVLQPSQEPGLQRRKDWHMWKMRSSKETTSWAPYGYNVKASERHCLKRKKNWATPLPQLNQYCILQRIGLALGLSLFSHPLREHKHNLLCQGGLSQIVFNSSQVFTFFRREFAIASHLGCKLAPSPYERQKPMNNNFIVLCTVTGEAYPDFIGVDRADLPIIAVTLDVDFYPLSDTFAAGLLGPKKKTPAKTASFPGAAGEIPTRGQKQASQRQHEKPQFVGYDGCPCDPCVKNDDFTANMSVNGPQRAFFCKLSIFDLMKMLGWLTPQWEQRLLQCCHMSISVFDVESAASPLSPSGMCQGPNLNAAAAAGVSRQAFPREAFASHQPVLLSYYDFTMYQEAQEPVIIDADPADEQFLVAEFVSLLLKRKEEVTQAKMAVLADLFTRLEKYKKVHFQFFGERNFLPPSYLKLGGYSRAVNDEEAMTSEDDDQFTDRVGAEVVAQLARDLETAEEGGTAHADPMSPESSSSADDYQDELPSAAKKSRQESSRQRTRRRRKQLMAMAASKGRKVVVDVGSPPNLEDNAEGHSSGSGSSCNQQLYRIKKKREARQILAIEQAWENNIFGLVEKKLKSLSRVFNCYALNAESFDLVLLYSQIVCYCKEQGIKRVSMQKEGAKIRFLKMGELRITDIKRLLAPGTSLDSFGKLAGLDIKKSIFPFEKFTSRDYLLEPSLPTEASDWASKLNPDKNPSQADVNEALRTFEEQGMTCVGDFLRAYLILDVKVLLQATVAMAKTYYSILKLDFTEMGKFTVSSVASVGAAHYLARNKKPAMFHVNHARTYRVRKHTL